MTISYTSHCLLCSNLLRPFEHWRCGAISEVLLVGVFFGNSFFSFARIGLGQSVAVCG